MLWEVIFGSRDTDPESDGGLRFFRTVLLSIALICVHRSHLCDYFTKFIEFVKS
ncbi:MAG: hypothetical protein UV53_C0022G0015 [Candidatus Azambacteria bacterium GW2011_GWE1_42_9]|nr:MAG: hypothetical protein UV53_C0022G0015 [Candidatus Azambacteria bacterium GW2011_GWE1_42_9]KKT03113.1 MAG: hypothetical protein UV81_C0004G0050 [Candidatus Azambacteria bacterium GW2011_GWD1_43_18]KKT12031.1 MAG: hypothetical protein UV93_C0009G0003 [Candidatus Azambacteria bacterium GW2011_GWC2_43_27]KKT17126.1 MAG: hypothetical protein UV99_C0001G0062 [Parcubacteria group bacterium GW2011_GWC1_43_61]